MDSNMQWLIDDLLDGESIENFTPKSKLEAYVKAALLKSGTDGLDIPVNRLDALLYWNADKAPDNYASAVEEGRNQYQSDFWDLYQANGARTGYGYAFVGGGWTDETFKPKYDMVPKGHINWMFEGVKITNLKQILKDCGVVLDTSNVTVFSETFAYCNYAGLTHIPTLDIRSATNLNYTFCNSRKIVEIEKIILKDDGSQKFSASFGNCNALEHIVFEGVIGQNISFGASPKLTHDSLMSIINHLKDYSEDTSGTVYTLTLHATAKARLTEAEIAIATEKGWTVA